MTNRRSFFGVCLSGLLGLVGCKHRTRKLKIEDGVGISFRVVSVHVPEGARDDVYIHDDSLSMKESWIKFDEHILSLAKKRLGEYNA